MTRHGRYRLCEERCDLHARYVVMPLKGWRFIWLAWDRLASEAWVMVYARWVDITKGGAKRPPPPYRIASERFLRLQEGRL